MEEKILKFVEENKEIILNLIQDKFINVSSIKSIIKENLIKNLLAYYLNKDGEIEIIEIIDDVYIVERNKKLIHEFYIQNLITEEISVITGHEAYKYLTVIGSSVLNKILIINLEQKSSRKYKSNLAFREIHRWTDEQIKLKIEFAKKRDSSYRRNLLVTLQEIINTLAKKEI